MNLILSKLKKLYIESNRVADHIYRRIIGLPMRSRSLITPDLFLGGQYTNLGLRKLQKEGITAIVNMRERSIHKKISGLWFEYLHLPTPDQHAPTLTALQKGAEFIDSQINKGGKVYIHCKHGEGRGPTMVIAYLVKTGLTLKDAFQLVQKIRIFIRPTKSQMVRLEEFERLSSST